MKKIMIICSLLLTIFTANSNETVCEREKFGWGEGFNEITHVLTHVCEVNMKDVEILESGIGSSKNESFNYNVDSSHVCLYIKEGALQTEFQYHTKRSGELVIFASYDLKYGDGRASDEFRYYTEFTGSDYNSELELHDKSDSPHEQLDVFLNRETLDGRIQISYKQWLDGGNKAIVYLEWTDISCTKQ